MATSVVINWQAPGAVIAASQSTTAGTPLTYTPNIVHTDTFTQTNTPFFQMPLGNVRTIVFSGTSAATFDIVGADERGNVLTENAVANGSTSANSYYQLFSITPSATGAGTVEIVTGNAGYTFWYKVDVWNQTDEYSLTYSHLGGGTFKVTAQLTQDDPEQYILDPTTKVRRLPLNSEIQAFPLPTAQLIFTPSTLANPVIEAGSMRLNYPVVALNSLVDATNVSSFRQSIVQQGGRY